MKICIYGAGAMGGSVVGRLCRLEKERGLDLSVVARGAHLDAIRAAGLKVIEDDGSEHVFRIRATEDPAELGRQDLVFVCLKAHQYPPAAQGIASLLGPKTRVVCVLNGIPWWYFHASGGAFEGHQIALLDPGGALWSAVGPQRVIAAISYVGGAAVAPGVVHHTVGKRFVIGEPDGSQSEDLETVRDLLSACGWDVRTTARIRDEIWLKLLRNASQNPLSVATGATVTEMLEDPRAVAFTLAVMDEVRAVGEAVGVRFPISNAAQLEDSRGLGNIKTSMLQDYESGRPLELDALVAAVEQIARTVAIPTPNLSALFSIVAQKAALKGLY